MKYFPFKSKGYFKPDKDDDWWMILTCDPEIVKYYCWFAKKWGIEIEPGSRHGPHISVIKGEKPMNYRYWKSLEGKPIEFEYSNVIKHNGYHAWLDVHSPELSKVRKRLGLDEKPYHSFHLTIGRLKLYKGHESHIPRPGKRRRKKK